MIAHLLRLALLAATLAGASGASGQNLVPSCYGRYPIGVAPAPSARDVFILIDETTALDPALTQNLRANVVKLIGPGTRFAIARFSAFRRGHFAEIVAAGSVEPAVPAQLRNSISVPKLRQIDKCLHDQPLLASRIALAGVAAAQKVSAATFSQSEIMSSLKQLSDPIAASRARDKVVIIASDMLEHSSATSFYAKKGLRQIDPAAELKKAAKNQLFGNFGGARLYVIGAGILPPEAPDVSRTIPALNALERFWTLWARQSGAAMAGFGRPSLLSPIR